MSKLKLAAPTLGVLVAVAVIAGCPPLPPPKPNTGGEGPITLPGNPTKVPTPLESAKAAYARLEKSVRPDQKLHFEVTERKPLGDAPAAVPDLLELPKSPGTLQLRQSEERNGNLAALSPEVTIRDWPPRPPKDQDLSKLPLKKLAILDVTLTVGEKLVKYPVVLAEYRFIGKDGAANCQASLHDPVARALLDLRFNPEWLRHDPTCINVYNNMEDSEKEKNYESTLDAGVTYGEDKCSIYHYDRRLPPMWSTLCWSFWWPNVVAYTSGTATASLVCKRNVEKNKCLVQQLAGTASVNATVQNNGSCTEQFGAIQDGKGEYVPLHLDTDDIGIHFEYHGKSGAYRASTTENRSELDLKGNCAGDYKDPTNHGTASAEAHYGAKKTTVTGQGEVVGRTFEDKWVVTCAEK